MLDELTWHDVLAAAYAWLRTQRGDHAARRISDPTARIGRLSTHIDRIARGFDFLGYHFSVDGDGGAMLTLAHRTVENFKTNLSRLHEQLHRASHQRAAALEAKINTCEPMDRLGSWRIW